MTISRLRPSGYGGQASFSLAAINPRIRKANTSVLYEK